VEKDFWALHNIAPDIEVYAFTPFEATDREKFKAIVKKDLPLSIKWEEVENLDEKIDDLFTGLCEDYSQVWCRSLTIGPEHAGNAEEILTLILRDILLARCEINKVEARNVLEDFLSDKYRFLIFKKSILAKIFLTGRPITCCSIWGLRTLPYISTWQ